jgi:hypothetical protein
LGELSHEIKGRVFPDGRGKKVSDDLYLARAQ